MGHLIQPSDRGEYELPDAVDLLIQSGRTIDAIRMGGWRSRERPAGARATSRDCVPRRIDVGYPDDRDRAEELLAEEEPEPAATSE